MKILMIGGGAREHALLHALERTRMVKMELFCAPGNGGISEIAKCFPVKADDLAGLLALAKEIKPDLTVVGPEAPLVAGIVKLFSDNEFRIVGPTAEAAMLEGSKKFAKEFMWRNKIPTPAARFFDNPDSAIDFIRNQLLVPPVVKADGLAAGKGVIVAKSKEEAIAAVNDIMVKKKFGDAVGKWILLEERHVGQECSLIVLTDGTNVIPFMPATDFKRRRDNNDGPNTGGMGCYSPVPALTGELLNHVMGKIVIPTIQGMMMKGTPYQGFLYFGLMLADNGPLVLEYNARMGDPEAAVILPLLSDICDLSELLDSSTMPNGLRGMRALWERGVAVGVVAVHGEYPEKSSSSEVITGISEAKKTGALVFHAGTAKNEVGETVTKGGRILDIIGIGKDFAEARDAAYSAMGCIHFNQMDYRTDIAAEIS